MHALLYWSRVWRQCTGEDIVVLLMVCISLPHIHHLSFIDPTASITLVDRLAWNLKVDHQTQPSLFLPIGFTFPYTLQIIAWYR